MNTFLFHRELDVLYLNERFQGDIFSAREILGSFVELVDQELNILEAALEQKKYKAFSRVADRLKNGLSLVGLQPEIQEIDDIKTHLATYGGNERLTKLCYGFIDRLRDKSNLYRIEVHRMNKHIEQAVNSGN